MTWSFAVSLVPGHVHAWGVGFRGHSRRQAFAITARHASVWFVPWALARKEIRLSRLRASGLAVALREGLVELPPPAPRDRPWSVVLSDARARDVWSVQLGPKLQLTGVAMARLDLGKVLSGGAVAIPRGELDWQRLALDWDGQRLVTGGRLAGTMTMAPMVPSKLSALEKLRTFSGDLEINGNLPSLELHEGGLQVASGKPAAGRLSGRIALRAGELASSSGFALRQPVHVQAEGLDADRELTARVQIVGERMQLAVDLPPGKTPATTISARISLPRLRDAPAQDPQRPTDFTVVPHFLASDATGHVDTRLRFKSLGLLRPLLRRWKGLDAEGEGWLDASLHFEHGRYLAEKSSIRFEDARLKLAALGHSVEARVDGSPERVDGPQKRYRLMLQEVLLRGPDGEELLRDADASLDLVAGKDRTSITEAPGLDFRMHQAGIPDLQVFNRYLPPDSLHFQGGEAVLALQLALEADQPKAQGGLVLSSGDARVAIADMRLRGGVRIETTLRDADLEQHTLDLSGTRLALDRVRFDVPGGKPVQDWNLRLSVDQAHAKIGTPLAMDGNGRVAMKDLSLLLAIYSHMKDYPAWVLRLVDAGQVEARGRFRVAGRELRLDGVHAENRRFKVQARLRLDGPSKTGALLAQWGPLSVGVGLGGPQAKMHLRGARDWFESGQP